MADDDDIPVSNANTGEGQIGLTVAKYRLHRRTDDSHRGQPDHRNIMPVLICCAARRRG